MKLLVATALLAWLAGTARAQEIRPAIDPVELSRVQVNSSMMRAQAERDRKAQLSGKRPASGPLTPAQQRAAHRREVEEAMRRPRAVPGSIR